jgi:hypothetical protein
MTVIRIADGEHGLASLYWYPASEFAGRDMLVVTKPRYDRSYLEPLFDSVEELPPLEIERGGEVVRSFRIYRGRGIRGPLDVFSRVASR